MNILITHYHGLTDSLTKELDGIATRLPTKSDERKKWKISDTTLDEFMAQWNKHFLTYPIKAEDKADTFDCDQLIYVTNKQNFYAC